MIQMTFEFFDDADDVPKRVKHKLAFLLKLTESDVASIDDATTDLNEKFEDGGSWRGGITLSLSIAGIIEKVGYELSNRPSRHRSVIAKWRWKDRAKGSREIEKLKRRYQKKNPSAATDGQCSQDGNPTNEKRNSDE